MSQPIKHWLRHHLILYQRKCSLLYHCFVAYSLAGKYVSPHKTLLSHYSKTALLNLNPTDTLGFNHARINSFDSGSGEVKPHGDREWAIQGLSCHRGQPAMHGQGLPTVTWRILSGPLTVTVYIPTQRIPISILSWHLMKLSKI